MDIIAAYEALLAKLRPLLPTIRQHLGAYSPVLSREDLDKRVFNAEARQALGIPSAVSTNSFLTFLVDEAVLELAKFGFPSRNIHRYLRGQPSIHQVVLSLKPRAYFSHYTAISIHGLTEQTPKTLYLNWEQRLSAGGGELDQERIDRVFKGKCRVSNNVATYKEYTIYILNGANTGELGVIDLAFADGTSLRVTGIERTLIDATVRPVYSGGVFQVLQAYSLARPQLSIDTLVKMLQRLSFTYPYHQAIGYYLEHTGYDEQAVEALRQFPMECDFYLDYGMKRTDYVPKWRLFVPKGF